MVFEIYNYEDTKKIKEFMKINNIEYKEYKDSNEISIYDLIWFTLEDMQNWNYTDKGLFNSISDMDNEEVSNEVFARLKGYQGMPDTTTVTNELSKVVYRDFIQSKFTLEDFKKGIIEDYREEVISLLYEQMVDDLCVQYSSLLDYNSLMKSNEVYSNTLYTNDMKHYKYSYSSVF